MTEKIYGDIWTLGFWANIPDYDKVLLGETVGDSTGTLHVSSYDDYKWYTFSYFKKGKYVENLTPVVVLCKSVETGVDITPLPLIQEIGGGIYKMEFNPTVPTVLKIDSGDITMCDVERYKVFMVSQYDGYVDEKVSVVKSVVDGIDEKIGEPVGDSLVDDLLDIGGKIDSVNMSKNI